MDIDAYLERIGYRGPREPTLENLHAMHDAHFRNVPFETIDIHIDRPLVLSEAAQFAKIVRDRRGGWCHELHGLWARALRQLGFNVDVIAARVMRDGQLSAPNGHVTVLVHFDETWLSDVDLSSRVAGPLRLSERRIQTFGDRQYIIANDADHWFLTLREPQMADMFVVFTLEPRRFEEFEEACQWQQTSPESHFTWQPMASLPTANGRVHLLGMKLVSIERGVRSERELESLAERDEVLRDVFGVVLKDHQWRQPLPPPE